MKPVRLAALAVDDLRDAVNWYEGQRPRLGARFASQIDALLARVGESPKLFPIAHLEIRRALVRPFPYGVFFRDLDSAVQVIAIVHLHRAPSTWRTRP